MKSICADELRTFATNQLEMGVVGGVAEIGVHHGMSFVPLCLLNADAGIYSYTCMHVHACMHTYTCMHAYIYMHKYIHTYKPT
jgi:acyl CoA:acetate/3-ketoacid CoA transferase